MQSVKINPIKLAEELDKLNFEDASKNALIMAGASVIRQLVKNLDKQISENKKLKNIILSDRPTR